MIDDSAIPAPVKALDPATGPTVTTSDTPRERSRARSAADGPEPGTPSSGTPRAPASGAAISWSQRLSAGATTARVAIDWAARMAAWV